MLIATRRFESNVLRAVYNRLPSIIPNMERVSKPTSFRSVGKTIPRLLVRLCVYLHGTSRALKLYYLACVSFYFFITEPNAPPSDVQGHNITSTSIQVQWGNVPAADQNGIILRYTVTYKASRDGSPLTKEVSAPTMQAKLTGLNEYTNYSITVFATTVKGNGNISAPIIVITDENSKFTITLSVSVAQKIGSHAASDVKKVT